MSNQQPPTPPAIRLSRRTLIILGVSILVFSVFSFIGSLNQGSTVSSVAQNVVTPTDPATPTSPPIQTSVPTTPTILPTVTPLPTRAPTPTPTPTLSPAQIEKDYKANTSSTSVDTLDKDGSNDTGHGVHFTCEILNFVKDDNGNTAAANVDNANSSSGSVIQIVFPDGTDVTNLNKGDSIEVWGVDAGVASGQNAFGTPIQEVVVSAQYMTDTTTGYQTS